MFVSTTSSSTNFFRKIVAYSWKRWVGISKCTSNSKLIHHLYEDDFLEEQKSKQPRGRSIALVYTNGLHHKIYTRGNCYGNSTETFCVCKFCGQHIDSPQDLYWTCPFVADNLSQTMNEILHSIATGDI